MKCIICGKMFFGRSNKIYCSHQCGNKAYYQNNKNIILKRSRKWEIENPKRKREINKKAVNKFKKDKKKRFNELMNNSYKKNKDKWASRNITNKIIKGTGDYKKRNILIKQCKKCGIKKDLQIHHEIYPRLVKEIIRAIEDKKIYYLCRECHLKETVKFK